MYMDIRKGIGGWTPPWMEAKSQNEISEIFLKAEQGDSDAQMELYMRYSLG